MGNSCCDCSHQNMPANTTKNTTKTKPIKKQTKKQKKKNNDKKNSKLVDLNLKHSEIEEPENKESLIESRNSYCYGVQIKITQENKKEGRPSGQLTCSSMSSKSLESPSLT